MTTLSVPPATKWSESYRRINATIAEGRFTGFLGVAAQLLAVFSLVYVFRIEPASGILRILPLIFAGFLVNAALPLRLRQPFFVFLSLTAAAVVLGPVPALVLMVLGLGFLGLCHLPIAFSTRVLLILLAAGALAGIRSGWNPRILSSIPGLGAGGVSRIVLPVLASMFMFRIVIYLYELRHEELAQAKAITKPGNAGARAPATIWARLSYFFLLPNVCFLLFPIVDYRTTRRTYYDTDAQAIYQRGVSWICLGLVHLLLYRLVYQYLVPSPEDVQGLGGVVRFFVSSYLIYLRVMGQFHLITGLLCLFGFNLPPSHKWVFLATGFTDFWRRARIDWKDFMVKVVYYPAVVPLQRKWSATPALVVATVFVFAATLLLHSYQWFWLTGEMRLSQTDAVFWSVFGACVLANSLLEIRTARRRTKARTGEFDLGRALGQALRIVGMFTFISILWSYWSSPSLAEWWSLVTAAGESGPTAYVALLAGLAGVVASLVLGQLIRSRIARRSAPDSGKSLKIGAAPARGSRLHWRPVAIAASFVFLILAVPAERGGFGEDAAIFAETLRSNRLNAVDQERHDRGYYETLLDEPRSTGGLIAANADNRPRSDSWDGEHEAATDSEPDADATAPDTPAESDPAAPEADDPEVQGPSRQTNDILRSEPLPLHTFFKKGHSIVTNRWGMRDKDYELLPSPGTYRIVLLGSSYERANGLPQTAGFEAIVEDRLNRSARNGRQYEILNFSNGFYSVLQHSVLTERRVFDFKPNAVFYALHSVDGRKLMPHLVWMVRHKIPIPYPYVRDKLSETGAKSDMGEFELRRRITPVLADIQRWSYRRIVELSRAGGATPVALVVPLTDEGPPDKARRKQYEGWAREAGFTIITLDGAYGNRGIEQVSLSPGDAHPSAFGNRLLADRLYAQLRQADGKTLALALGREAPALPAAEVPAAGLPNRVAAAVNSENGREKRRRKGWSGGAPAFARSEVVELTDNVIQFELLKSYDGRFKGASFVTNRWGMRDADYAKARPRKSYRVALLGSSLTMGAGVPENATFQALIEDRLNREGPASPARRYEILNFGVANYTVLQHLAVLEQKALSFEPNVVMIALEPNEVGRLAKQLNSLQAPGSDVPYAFVREKLKSSGVAPGAADQEKAKRLYEAADAVIAWSFQRIAAECRRRGIKPVAFALSTPGGSSREEEALERLVGQARGAGFLVLGVAVSFSPGQGDAFSLKGNLYNVEGHRVVADRVYQMLLQNQRALGITPGSARSSLLSPSG